MKAVTAAPATSLRPELTAVLAALRAQYLLYQTEHWTSAGATFMSDHILFERLYKSVEEQIDQLAEKIVSYFGWGAADSARQIALIAEFAGTWSKGATPADRGLESERAVQGALRAAYDAGKASGTMTLGLDDWLMSTANQHETNTYLLQQRAV